MSTHYVRARHYSTVNRLWTTVDPLWPGENTYVYSSSNPCSISDYTGATPGPWLPKPPPRYWDDCKTFNDYVYSYCRACESAKPPFWEAGPHKCKAECERLKKALKRHCRKLDVGPVISIPLPPLPLPLPSGSGTNFCLDGPVYDNSWNLHWGYANWCGRFRPPDRKKLHGIYVDDLDYCCKTHDVDLGDSDFGGITGCAHCNLLLCAKKVTCWGPYESECLRARGDLMALMEILCAVEKVQGLCPWWKFF